MIKNKYAVWVFIAIVFLTVGYWVGTSKNDPKDTSQNISEVIEINATPTPSEPTSSTPAVSKPKPSVPKTVIVSRGRFSGSGGHTAWGTVTIERTGTIYTLRLGNDFLVTSGPDLYVYLGRTNQFEPGFKVGALQISTGVQTYSLSALPQEARYYDEVFIWNEPNSLPFAKAILTVAQ